MKRLLRAVATNEQGSTMAAVMMVLMAVTVISTASIQLAQHSNDVSSVDRERFQSVSAAEAGVTSAIDRLETGAGCDAAATSFSGLHDGDKLLGRYRNRIDPESGTTCGQTPMRVIHSWGYAPTGGTRALRHLEVTVKLVPNAGFPFTLFAEGSNGTIFVKNNGTIDGDVYSEVLDQSKNNLAADDILTPGSVVTQNNATYTGTIWAGNSVTIGQNSNVGQSIIAAGSTGPGNINLGDNAYVGGDVVRKGSLTLGSGVVVAGSTPPASDNIKPPPVLTKPTFDASEISYDHVGTAAQITALLNTNRGNLQGEYRATDGGIVAFPDNVTVTGPLTVVSEGPTGTGRVVMGRTMSGTGPHLVVIVAQSTAANAIDIAKSLTISSGLHTLLFTSGGVDLKNHVSMTGSIYADSIDLKNTFTISSSDILATTEPTGFHWSFASSSSYSAVPTLWREIVPGEPPP